MTNFTKPHGPQGVRTQTADRRPWKAPRLIDLDDEQTNSPACMMAGNKAQNFAAELSDHVSCYFEAHGMMQVAFS